MTSSRLPGKVLKEVLRRPLLSFFLERVRRVQAADQIILATTDLPTDDPIVQFCDRNELPYFRGSEQDVLSRYYEAAKVYGVDTIVRVTSDCPLIDPAVISHVIKTYQEKGADYVSNTLERSYPRGMDTEVFSFAMLEEAHWRAIRPLEREHVTPYFYQNPSRFKLANVRYPVDESSFRVTLDTAQDYELIRLIFEELYPTNPQFDLAAILETLKAHPHWVAINQEVAQKEFQESTLR